MLVSWSFPLSLSGTFLLLVSQSQVILKLSFISSTPLLNPMAYISLYFLLALIIWHWNWFLVDCTLGIKSFTYPYLYLLTFSWAVWVPFCLAQGLKVMILLTCSHCMYLFLIFVYFLCFLFPCFLDKRKMLLLSSNFISLLTSEGNRYSLPNSRIMIHQPLGGAQGGQTDIDIQV